MENRLREAYRKCFELSSQAYHRGDREQAAQLMAEGRRWRAKYDAERAQTARRISRRVCVLAATVLGGHRSVGVQCGLVCSMATVRPHTSAPCASVTMQQRRQYGTCHSGPSLHACGPSAGDSGRGAARLPSDHPRCAGSTACRQACRMGPHPPHPHTHPRHCNSLQVAWWCATSRARVCTVGPRARASAPPCCSFLQTGTCRISRVPAGWRPP